MEFWNKKEGIFKFSSVGERRLVITSNFLADRFWHQFFPDDSDEGWAFLCNGLTHSFFPMDLHIVFFSDSGESFRAWIIFLNLSIPLNRIVQGVVCKWVSGFWYDFLYIYWIPVWCKYILIIFFQQRWLYYLVLIVYFVSRSDLILLNYLYFWKIFSDINTWIFWHINIWSSLLLGLISHRMNICFSSVVPFSEAIIFWARPFILIFSGRAQIIVVYVFLKKFPLSSPFFWSKSPLSPLPRGANMCVCIFGECVRAWSVDKR